MTTTPAPSFFTPKRIGLASAAAVAGCAACCALPLLALAGIGGGATAAVAGLLQPGMELLIGAGLFAVVLGGLRLAQQRRAAAAAACSVDGSCGCGPQQERVLFRTPSPSPDEPIACSGDLKNTAAVQAHIDAYRHAFSFLVATEHFGGGFRWRFRQAPGLDDELRGLATREHECCRFFAFDVRDAGDDVVWEVRAPESAAAMLQEFARMPERLRAETRPLHDLHALKDHTTAAGLAFTRDAPFPAA